ncbi:hypothetical protein [Yoonia sp. R78084]|uniref:8-oxoguanine DNA glycosylase OGG fold protein n=1 Tax=Yoonia sp. R78084 TaxID=3093869 RepID=UPI0037DC5C16
MTVLCKTHSDEFKKYLNKVKALPSHPTNQNGLMPLANKTVATYLNTTEDSSDYQRHKTRHNRNDLRKLTQTATKANIEYICAAILAWGGMTVPNFKSLFGSDHKSEWLSVALEIKNGNPSRQSAFAKFSNLRAKKMIPGMGPAYFTKLIYFLMPEGKMGEAYILDQWAGWSINTLFNDDIVLLNTSHTWTWKKSGQFPVMKPSKLVSDMNTAENYEAFCKKVDELITELGSRAKMDGISPSDLIDRTFMFEKGGSGKTWRDYLIHIERNARPKK